MNIELSYEHINWREEDRFDDPLLKEQHEDEYALASHEEEFIK